MRGRGSGNSDEFIREVDEAVRQDRWLQLWKQYGALAIGAAIAIVLGTAAGVGWRTYQHNQRLDEARRFAAAQQLLEQDKPAEAATAFAALADDADTGYTIMARLRTAQAEGEAGEGDAMAATLGRLAEDDGAPDIYRDLAQLLAIQAQFDQVDPATLVRRLEPLAAADRPWRHSARELQALAQLRAGDGAAARQTLDDLIADPTTPPQLARRATQLLAAQGGPLGDTKEQTAAGDDQ